MIDSACTLSYSDGNVVVGKGAEYCIPIAQIKNMLVQTSHATISAVLLNELAKNNVHTVFCDERHNPSLEISAYTS